MDEYQAQWKVYRRLVIYFVAIFVGYVPAMIAVSFLLEKLFHTEAAFTYVAGFWTCLWVLSFVRVCMFACPRCGKCFIGKWWYGNFYLFRKCARCGLPRDPNVSSVFAGRR